MATTFRQWESDPLFSAAEVVQDSADRMESIFRILLHEQSLLQGDPADPKLPSSIEYHRRDLATALGTTKWQLEDFERAVNISTLLGSSPMREGAISRHKQFICAIREQIVHVEKSLDEQSTGDSVSNSQWVNLNEQDRDGLALFLSGGNQVDHNALFDSDSSIMRRFLDSTTASGFDHMNDEIVELKTEEIEDSKVNGVMYIDRSFDSLMEDKLRKVGSHYSTRLGFDASISIQESPMDKEGGSEDLDVSDSNAKSFISKSRLRGSRNRFDILGFLSNFWLVYGIKIIRAFSKRRKDGDTEVDFIQRPPSSFIDISHVERGRHARMWLASGLTSSRGLCSDAFTTMQSCNWVGDCSRGLQRLQYIIQFNRLSMRLISTIFLTLIFLGILIFQVA